MTTISPAAAPARRIDRLAIAAPRPSDFVAWEGPSEYDGSPVVVVATGIDRASRNEKTGAMVQVWIIRADVSPVVALQDGRDAGVCGTCVHRPALIRAGESTAAPCYVRVSNAPRAVYVKYAAGGYDRQSPAAGNAILQAHGAPVRIGAYGDPAAVPVAVWNELLQGLEGRVTGYTHGWDGRAVDGLEKWAMASTDDADQLQRARAMGYRSFRVRADVEELAPREIACPASAEAGYRTDCASCRACGGLSARAKVDIAIIVHGAGSVAFNRAAAARIAA